MPEPRRRDLLESIRAHPGLSLTIGGAVWFVLAVLAVSNFDRRIAVAVAREVDLAEVGFGILVSAGPMVIYTLIFFAILADLLEMVDFYPSGGSTRAGLITLCLYVCLSLPPEFGVMFSILVLILLVPPARNLVRRWAEDSRSADNKPGLGWLLEDRRALSYLVVVLLLAPPVTIAKSAFPWEVVELDEGRRVVAKVISADDSSLILLTDGPSQFGRIPDSAVVSREFCDHEQRRTMLEVLVGRKLTSVPKCP